MNNLKNSINKYETDKILLLKHLYLFILIIILVLNLFKTGYNMLFLKEENMLISDFYLIDTEFVNDTEVITITSDSQMHYSNDVILNLYFKADTLFAVGEWVLFYQDDIDKDFSADKILYAKLDNGYYSFTLPFNTKKIRFDLGVTASNTINFEELTINKRTFDTINSFTTQDLFNLITVPIILFSAILLINDILKILTKKGGET